MLPRRFVPLLASLTLATARLAAAQTANPDSARLITRDIPNFWRAIDQSAGKDSAALVAALRTDYLANPSPGLRDWVASRLISQRAVVRALAAAGVDTATARRALNAAADGTRDVADSALFETTILPAMLDNAAVNLANVYSHNREYYDAIRANTLSVATSRTVTDAIRASFRRLKAIYPDARFGDVYFLMGIMNSAGTTGSTELLLGTEMNARDPSTPMDGLSAWHKAVIGQVSDLPHIVAHEMIHTEQAPIAGRRTLLASALQEGGADFLAELISGHHIINPAYAYGDAHRAELWAEFRKAMDSTNTSGWLFQGDRTAPGVPADLGYWMGYRIAKAYYDRAADKAAAVRGILRAGDDPHAFLTASGYGS